MDFKSLDNSIILVDKPIGLSSFGVVKKVRYRLSHELNKKIKVGHTGTLDPFASGLLILLTGNKCKEANNYLKLDKVYQATIVLGKTSDTYDKDGTIITVSNLEPTRQLVDDALKVFTGVIDQVPPRYSAIKINGQRAYQLARKDEDFIIPKRTITIYSIRLVSYSYPRLVIRVSVSSGTYIRTLASDIGSFLKTGAYCEDLRRLQVGDMTVDKAYQLEDFN